MSNFSISRRIMVVMTVAAVALGGIALPAAAKGRPEGRGKQQTVETVSAKGKARAEARRAEARARKAALRFVAVGFVTAVDTAEVQVQVKGGNKALRKLGVPVDFTVADGAKIKRDGERVALDALQVGDHVMVKGAKIGETLTARKVIASSPEEDEAEESTEGDDSQGTEDATGGTDGGTTTDGSTGTDDTTGTDGGTTTDGSTGTDDTTGTEGGTTTP